MLPVDILLWTRLASDLSKVRICLIFQHFVCDKPYVGLQLFTDFLKGNDILLALGAFEVLDQSKGDTGVETV